MLRRLTPFAAILLCAGSAAVALRPQHTAPPAVAAVISAPAPASAPQNSYSVVGSYPHDTDAFTEGLLWKDDGFYESTGLNGQSSLRRVAFPSGKVTKEFDLKQQYFGEGLALIGDELIQLTWQNKVGFVYDKDSFAPRRTFPLTTEGWGLTYDGQQLVMSDGTPTLSFLDPQTFKVTRRMNVTWDGVPVRLLNELEAIHGEIWANIWQSDLIVRIDPQSGHVKSFLDLTTLFPQAQRGDADVMNGIAYDAQTDRVYVTGKLWPKIYALKISDRTA